MTRSREPEVTYIHTVSYDSTNHLSVIFQRFGSVWPKVLPHCLANLGITGVLLYLLRVHQIDLTISEYGHEFMSLLIAFLVVSKCTTTMNIYFEFRASLSQIFQSAIELVQLATAFSGRDEKSKEWRYAVAYQAIKLLQTTTAMLTQANTTGVNAWEVLDSSEEEQTLRHGFDETGFLHSKSTEDNLHIPVRMAHTLRSVITSHGGSIDSIREQQLLQCVQTYMTGFYGIRKYLTTPMPFAFVQMARTFLFWYVYTLPFALLSVENSQPLQMVALVFLATYGYIGVEMICIELDDPFGDDPHDLPVVKDTKTIAEDIYWSIYQSDGLDSANSLMMKVRQGFGPKKQQGMSQATEASSLLP